MMSILRKLLIGKVSRTYQSKYNPIQKRILNIRSIWNNDHQDDNGIEKIVRLILSSSQLLFPGIYIKYLANRIGNEYKDLALDVYVLAKVAFPFLHAMQKDRAVVVFLLRVNPEILLRL